MTKHTSGYWKVPKGHPESVCSDNRVIAYMSKASDVAVMQANARFIATAPEMLEALEILLHEYEQLMIHVNVANSTYFRSLVYNASLVIAKAKGSATTT